MVIDDVRALPSRPLVVAEGSTVPPSLISAGLADVGRAVWLLPTTAFHEQQLAGHEPGARRLFAVLRDAIEQETRELGAPVFPIDGSRGIDEMTDAIEAVFAEAIAAGPRAETFGERRALLREANQALADQVRGFYARPWANGDAETVVRTFVCECGASDCVENVQLAVLASNEPVYAPGHG
jgi:hypothetical protein